jgi:HEAT repeat protein
MHHHIAHTLCFVSLWLATATSAQEPRVEPPTWPELSSKETEAAKLALRRLGDEDEEVADAAEAELQDLGPAVAPILLARLADRRPQHEEVLARVLHRVVPATHAPLIADKATSKAALLRSFSVEFLAGLGDEAYRPVFEKARKDKDEGVAFRAVLGLAGLRDEGALLDLLGLCETLEWRDVSALIQSGLAHARDGELTDKLVKAMPRDDERRVVTGLRLLRSIAPKEYAGVIATWLDAEQHAVKKEAINTLRAVVDGERPLENLSVFQAIDQAKKWKARIR